MKRQQPSPSRTQRTEWLDRLDRKGRRTKQFVTIGLRELTHDDAREWLIRVDGDYQRTMSPMVMIRYASDMDSGDWVPGCPMIVFDGKGRLINGQHVLSAFARSKLEKLLVVWQINRHPEAYMAFDHNRKRTPKDTLKWHGVDKPKETASAATVLWQYEQGFFRGKGYRSARGGDRFPTDAQIQSVVRTHPGLDKHLWKNPFRGKCLSIGALCTASYILHNIEPAIAAKFFESLIEGINIPSTHHPVAVLRKAFLDLGEGERMRNGETLARIFKAWNVYIRGNSISGPLLKKDETFPEPLDPADLEPQSLADGLVN
jgi:hypothetical protein